MKHNLPITQRERKIPKGVTIIAGSAGSTVLCVSALTNCLFAKGRLTLGVGIQLGLATMLVIAQ